ncbi:colicin E3-like toxin immunity protein [Sodalis endosymbiont of Spalangia cameroni]|uniref:colicin E3-like toxin immunity protein n=1 Tax=Sodalis praecaptivus TaxID=1239307 RepID=UPI0031F92B44
MGLRLRLHWFDKKIEHGIDYEYSSDFGDDRIIVDRLGLPVAHNINNGYFDVEKHWIPMLQPLFYHWINLEDHHYQVAFDYKDKWDIKDNSKKGHDMITEQFISIDELVGIPLPYPLAEPPKGWFPCYGQPFDKEKYPKLAKCYPDGKLPDLRGEFIRGWDNDRGIDMGRRILSEQKGTLTGAKDDNNDGHDISILSDGHGINYGSDPVKVEDYPGAKLSYITTPQGSEEIQINNQNAHNFYSVTRPRNIAFNYIVRAA